METYNINLSPFTSEGKSAVKVVIEGDLSIRNAQNLKEPLEAAFNKYDLFEVELQNITALDITSIQLMYSLKKAVRAKSKTMNLTLNVSEEIQNVLEYSGLTKILHPEKFRESI